MKKLYVQYCYSSEQWGIYDPDIDDILYLDDSMTHVVSYAYDLSALIKPCKVILIPKYLLTPYTISTCY